MALLLYLSVSISLMALALAHPVALTVTIILQTLLVTAMISALQESFWFGFILFLVFLGGMLILFSYITSLASNFLFKFSNKMVFFMLPPLLVLPSLAPLPQLVELTPLTQSINQFYFQNTFLTLMMVAYLLMILLIVVAITNSPLGPLRHQSL